METEFIDSLERAILDDGRYPLEAYDFLQRGLAYATRMVHGEGDDDAPRHVTGQQLCMALRALALKNWGLLAPLVLGSWNIRATRDFGEMVFLLVELKLLGRQETDTIADFDRAFDFDEAFRAYRIPIDNLDDDLDE